LKNIKTQELHVTDMTFHFVIDDTQLMINASNQDLGICFVPELLVYSDIQDGG